MAISLPLVSYLMLSKDFYFVRQLSKTVLYFALLQVPLVSSVDVWLAALLKSINESLQSSIVNCMQDIDSGHSIEEWISKVCHWAVTNFLSCSSIVVLQGYEFFLLCAYTIVLK